MVFDLYFLVLGGGNDFHRSFRCRRPSMRWISWWIWSHSEIHCGSTLINDSSSCWMRVVGYTYCNRCKCIVHPRNASSQYHSSIHLSHVYDVLSCHSPVSGDRMDTQLWNEITLHLETVLEGWFIEEIVLHPHLLLNQIFHEKTKVILVLVW